MGCDRERRVAAASFVEGGDIPSIWGNGSDGITRLLRSMGCNQIQIKAWQFRYILLVIPKHAVCCTRNDDILSNRYISQGQRLRTLRNIGYK